MGADRPGSTGPGTARGWGASLAALTLTFLGLALGPSSAAGHPLGNFSVSHYAAIRAEAEAIHLRYVIDLAEIPTFQEIQEASIVAEQGHPSLAPYLRRKAETLGEGLRLELNGRRLALRAESTDVIFPPGAGGLLTMKIGVRFRAETSGPVALNRLTYADANYADRAGWKEVIAVAGEGVTLGSSSVPERDRSAALTDYPTDLIDSPPQALEARIVYTSKVGAAPDPVPSAPPTRDAVAPVPPGSAHAAAAPLAANRRVTPRNAFTQLMTAGRLDASVVFIALVVAAGLGAFHALEPGHGKTVVGAYLVGSRGTAYHALLLGLIVTASHTAGVYLLGAVTLYASRFIVPERLYPWLGATSGVIIAVLGAWLLVRRYAGLGDGRGDHGRAGHHDHRSHRHDDAHDDESHDHGAGHDHGDHHHDHPDAAHVHFHGGPAHRHVPRGAVSLRELFALGVSGGIVPCPAALVVLLSAVSLQRVGFGLLLIVAFSVGLAAVLIAIGLLVVYAGKLMLRMQGEGPLITRWLPLASSAVMTLFGLGIAVQALAPWMSR